MKRALGAVALVAATLTVLPAALIYVLLVDADDEWIGEL